MINIILPKNARLVNRIPPPAWHMAYGIFGELEVTDVNNLYLAEGRLRWAPLSGFWRDAGTFKTLAEVNTYWREVRKGKER